MKKKLLNKLNPVVLYVVIVASFITISGILLSCTQPNGKHPMYPVDTVQVDTVVSYVLYTVKGKECYGNGAMFVHSKGYPPSYQQMIDEVIKYIEKDGCKNIIRADIGISQVQRINHHISYSKNWE